MQVYQPPMRASAKAAERKMMEHLRGSSSSSASAQSSTKKARTMRPNQPLSKPTKTHLRPSSHVLNIVREELIVVLDALDGNRMDYHAAADHLNAHLEKNGIDRNTYFFNRLNLYKIRNGTILSKMTGRAKAPVPRVPMISKATPASAIKPQDLSEKEITTLLNAWIRSGVGSIRFIKRHPQYNYLTRQALEHWKRSPRFSHLFKTK